MNPYNNIELLKKAKSKAKKLNVDVRPSKKKNKKLDVITSTGKIISIGDLRYEDYNIHQNNIKRKNYKSRHESNRHKKGSAGYYADKILW